MRARWGGPRRSAWEKRTSHDEVVVVGDKLVGGARAAGERLPTGAAEGREARKSGCRQGQGRRAARAPGQALTACAERRSPECQRPGRWRGRGPASSQGRCSSQKPPSTGSLWGGRGRRRSAAAAHTVWSFAERTLLGDRHANRRYYAAVLDGPRGSAREERRVPAQIASLTQQGQIPFAEAPPVRAAA